MSCHEKDRINTLINKANELVNLNSDSSAILLLQEIPEEELSIDSLKVPGPLCVNEMRRTYSVMA